MFIWDIPVFLNSWFVFFVVILGSSGKTVQGPQLLPVDGDEVHRVQGFVVNNDEVEAGKIVNHVQMLS